MLFKIFFLIYIKYSGRINHDDAYLKPLFLNFLKKNGTIFIWVASFKYHARDSVLMFVLTQMQAHKCPVCTF